MIKVLAFTFVILFSILLIPANADVASLSLENPSYTNDEMITFVGMEEDGKKSVFVIIRDPVGDFVGVVSDPASDNDGNFVTIPRDVSLFFTSGGIYTATAFTQDQREEDGITISLLYDRTKVTVAPKIVRFIGIEADQPKERFPVIFRCLDSTFVNVSVKGSLFFEIPDFEPGNKIKAPGGTNLVKIQYDEKLKKIETMKFYKNDKLLGIHEQFDDQKDVNLFGKVQNWECENDNGSFPKNSKEVEIEVGSFIE